jgi:RNA polymerase sigma-70 factor (ECF subfamily)
MSEHQLSPAVETLVDHHRRFLSFLEHRVGDRQLAEDILQESFARGLEKVDAVRDPERIVAWFYRLLRNAVTDRFRARAAEGRALEAFAREIESEQAPADLAERICACFEPLIDELPPAQARILRQVDLEDRRPLDVATAEGITANNAMVRLHRARRSLAERLRQVCRTCADHGCFDCHCGTEDRP